MKRRYCQHCLYYFIAYARHGSVGAW